MISALYRHIVQFDPTTLKSTAQALRSWQGGVRVVAFCGDHREVLFANGQLFADPQTFEHSSTNDVIFLSLEPHNFYQGRYWQVVGIPDNGGFKLTFTIGKNRELMLSANGLALYGLTESGETLCYCTKP